MEEFFRGLVERTQYYEQFESFRNANISRQFREMPAMDMKMKVPAFNL